VLKERFGLSVVALAYPNGDYSERDMALVREAGYSCALTVDPGVNDVVTDLYALKRIYMPDDASIGELSVRASGIWDTLMRMVGYHRAFGKQAAIESDGDKQTDGAHRGYSR
jgi:hypothetical protein